MDIGARLKIAGDSIGYTLEKASQESGVGRSSISEFENGKREPRFSQLSSLAIRALRDGRLSLMQFAEYMRISYRRAGEYLTDEEVSISVA